MLPSVAHYCSSALCVMRERVMWQSMCSRLETRKQRPPFPPAASVSAMGSPGRVVHSSDSASLKWVRYPSDWLLFSPLPLCVLWGCPAIIQEGEAWDQYANSGHEDEEPRCVRGWLHACGGGWFSSCHSSHIPAREGVKTEWDGGWMLR